MRYEVKINKNQTKAEALQYLEEHGYTGVKEMPSGFYEVEKIGIVTPEISVLSDIRYGGVLREEREHQGLSLDAMANLLLFSPESLRAVEAGELPLSDARLQMAANVLQLSKADLEEGVRKYLLNRPQIQERIERMESTRDQLWERYMYFDAELGYIREKEGEISRDTLQKKGLLDADAVTEQKWELTENLPEDSKEKEKEIKEQPLIYM